MPAICNPSARHLLPALLIGVLAYAGFFAVGVKPSFDGINSDAAIYIVMADRLSPWRSQTFDFAQQVFALYPFPPLYPMTLAVVGADSTTPTLIYTIDAALLAIAAAASWLWARRAGGALPVALATVAVNLTPIALFTAMGVFSEPLYLALTMAALALLASNAPSSRHWLAAATLLGLAAVTRSVGIFALPPLLFIWWRRAAVREPWVPLAALLPTLIWSAVKWRYGWHGGYTDGLFTAGLWPGLMALLHQIPTNLQALAYHLLRCFDILGNRYSAVACTLLAALAGLALAVRTRRVALDALYVAAYMTVILLWPFPNHYPRFLWVILPFFAAYACWGAGLLVELLGQARLASAASLATAAVILCITLPSTLLVTLQIVRADSAQQRIYTRVGEWYGYDRASDANRVMSYAARVRHILEQIGAQLPAGSCVTSTAPERVMLHAGRFSQRPPASNRPLPALRASLAACPYVLMLRARAWPAINEPLYYPQNRVATELETLRIDLLDPAQAHSPPLVILARYVGTQRATGVPANPP